MYRGPNLIRMSQYVQVFLFVRQLIIWKPQQFKAKNVLRFVSYTKLESCEGAFRELGKFTLHCMYILKKKKNYVNFKYNPMLNSNIHYYKYQTSKRNTDLMSRKLSSDRCFINKFPNLKY